MTEGMTMFEHDLILIKKGEPIRDEDDNLTYEEIKRKILCSESSVSRADFYSAAQTGLEVNKVVQVNPIEYDDETRAEYRGKTYDIIRTYGPIDVNGFEMLEIYLGSRLGYG